MQALRRINIQKERRKTFGATSTLFFYEPRFCSSHSHKVSLLLVICIFVFHISLDALMYVYISKWASKLVSKFIFIYEQYILLLLIFRSIHITILHFLTHIMCIACLYYSIQYKIFLFSVPDNFFSLSLSLSFSHSIQFHRFFVAK